MNPALSAALLLLFCQWEIGFAGGPQLAQNPETLSERKQDRKVYIGVDVYKLAKQSNSENNIAPPNKDPRAQHSVVENEETRELKDIWQRENDLCKAIPAALKLLEKKQTIPVNLKFLKKPSFIPQAGDKTYLNVNDYPVQNIHFESFANAKVFSCYVGIPMEADKFFETEDCEKFCRAKDSQNTTALEPDDDGHARNKAL